MPPGDVEVSVVKLRARSSSVGWLRVRRYELWSLEEVRPRCGRSGARRAATQFHQQEYPKQERR